MTCHPVGCNDVILVRARTAHRFPQLGPLQDHLCCHGRIHVPPYGLSKAELHDLALAHETH